MPSVFSHAIAATALGAVMADSPPRRIVWTVGALCAVLPDLDVLTIPLGVPWGHVLSHRGLSHSLPFAAGLALVVTAVVSPWVGAGSGRLRRWAFFCAATASHGILDAMTTGGPGIAFFAPFSDARYFFPWRPIVVSPLGISAFFSRWGLAVIASELLWLWLPAAVVFLAARAATCRRRP